MGAQRGVTDHVLLILQLRLSYLRLGVSDNTSAFGTGEKRRCWENGGLGKTHNLRKACLGLENERGMGGGGIEGLSWWWRGGGQLY